MFVEAVCIESYGFLFVNTGNRITNRHGIV